ncbi:MAG TPA: polysaccharide lyase, partial [Chlamydiales bacterium]|nr:polysaccharide lyase [Chlamydiales bacterium]
MKPNSFASSKIMLAFLVSVFFLILSCSQDTDSLDWRRRHQDPPPTTPTTPTTPTPPPTTPTNPTSPTTRANLSFQALGTETDAISKWAVVGTSTSYGITKAAMGGRNAIRFEVRKGDPIFAGGLRAELSRYSDVNTATYEVMYGISYYIPTDWVNDQPTLFDIVHQFHDNSYGVSGETEYKSPFDFGVDGTNWQFQVRSGAGNVEKKFVIAPIEKGKWVNFVVHIKFVKTGSAGLVEIWKDGTKTNTYNGAVGFDHYYAPYFKMGNYKWPWNPQDLACCGATNSTKHVIYISNVRLGS